jgi:hypothetical protein
LLKVNDLVKSREQQQSLHILVSLLLELPDVPASLLQADFLEQTFAQVVGIAAHGQQRDKLRSDFAWPVPKRSFGCTCSKNFI